MSASKQVCWTPVDPASIADAPGAWGSEGDVASPLTRRVIPVTAALVLVSAIAPVARAADDVTPPTGTVSINSGAVYSHLAEVTLSVPATDAESDVATVSVSNDGATWTDFAYQPSLQWFLPYEPLTEGSHTVHVRWTDGAGNTSAARTDSIIVDVTPPAATVELWSLDPTSVTFRLTATDAHGIDDVRLTCGTAPPIRRPYEPMLTVPVRETGLGCFGYGTEFVSVEVLDVAGNASWGGAYIGLAPSFSLDISGPAITGQSMTITPVLPDDYVLPSNGGCRWEFRWGDDASLDSSEVDETYGGLLFDIPAKAGKCQPWTFTLPWVPYRQYDIYVNPFTIEDGAMVMPPGAQERFMGAVGTTERRILSSSLPIAQVLPNTYTPIVGQPITYTRYLIGGATTCCNARWIARQGNGENPTQWTQSGGSTFTFTPQRPGDVVVGWDRESASHLLLAGYYDPPVRYRDSTPPIATAPAVRVTRGVIKGLVPVLIGWTATDKGWGVATYRLQRSVDGGAWTNVALKDPSSRSTIAWVPNKHLVRFRISAVDKAGNVGTWATGSSFRPMNDPRTPVALSRTVPHP